MSEAERDDVIDEINAALNKVCIKGDSPYEFSSFKLSKVTLCLAITALHTQSEAEKKIERIKNVMEYFAESGNHARALYIIQCILDGMTDEEIMEGN